MDRQPPANRTYDESWGAAKTQLPDGRVRLSLDGVTVEAESEKRARVELARRLWVDVDGPADPAGLREYHLAYAESKIERYEALRETYAAMKPDAPMSVASIGEESSEQTARGALRLIDHKLAEFARRVAARDGEDRQAITTSRVR